VKIPQLTHAAVAVAVVVVGTIPIVVDAPAAIAQVSVNKLDSPVDCVPVGVTKDPDGTVWALEDCNGDIFKHRMTPVKPR
jgi:streptogramin lyase